MKPTTIFISYNPRNEFEQTLAIRLHTIGAVHGFKMLLPDRHTGLVAMSSETVYRIKSADYFILFSTSLLTPLVKQEITTAFEHLQDKSKILIIYNKVKNLKHNQNCTEVYVDASKDSAKEILEKVIDKIKKSQEKESPKSPNEEEETTSVLGGILLIGLGLLALDSLFNKNK